MMLIRRNRSLWVRLLSLALLFAQFGMAVHAATHLQGEGDVSAAQLCDYCIASSALQNMGGGDASFEFAVHALHASVVEAPPVALPASATFTAFRSRAPPQIL
jgi:hypothetical protein